MDQSLAISITLCHQFRSTFYKTSDLKRCIVSAGETAEKDLDNINIVFDDVEDGLHADLIHENVMTAIRKSHIVLFELSDVNPNVLYELGVAKGLNKPIVILRERQAKKELPKDVDHFLHIVYDQDDMDDLHSRLTKAIIKAYKSYDEMSLLSKSLQKKVVDHFMKNEPDYLFQALSDNDLVKILNNKGDFARAFDQVLLSTKMNFYYIGAMGFLSSAEQWIEMYNRHFDGDKVFSRIVYLVTLREFYDIYDDEEMLVDYCLWLAQNYYLLKQKIIAINLSEDVGIWKNGLSLVVSDEEKMIISTGSFSNEYNNKGLLIKHREISKMFKEYAKILSVKSKSIKPGKMAHFFSWDEDRNTVPEPIQFALETADFTQLQSACETYVTACLNS